MDEPDSNFMVGNYHVVQIGEEWHVLFQPDKYPRQFLSVARFQDYDRAAGYAGIESDMNLESWGQNEDIHKIADLSTLPVKVAKVIPPLRNIPEIEGPPSDLEKEILADLSILMKDYPYGVSMKELAEYYGLTEMEHRVRTAMKSLAARKLAVVATWPDEQHNEARIVPLDYERPAMRLTDPERAVLDAIKKLSNSDGICGVSARTIGITAGFGKAGRSLDLVWSLKRKGIVEILPDETGDISASCKCRLVELSDH